MKMSKEQAVAILKSVIDGMKLTAMEREQLLMALQVASAPDAPQA